VRITFLTRGYSAFSTRRHASHGVGVSDETIAAHLIQRDVIIITDGDAGDYFNKARISAVRRPLLAPALCVSAICPQLCGLIDVRRANAWRIKQR